MRHSVNVQLVWDCMPNASMSVLCYNAVVGFSIGGNVILEKTCTRVLQKFHHCRNYKGSPLQARNINMPGADHVTNFDFDQFMPLFQPFKPANAKTLAHDHDFFQKTCDEHFLDLINVTEISEKEVKL